MSFDAAFLANLGRNIVNGDGQGFVAINAVDVLCSTFQES